MLHISKGNPVLHPIVGTCVSITVPAFNLAMSIIFVVLQFSDAFRAEYKHLKFDRNASVLWDWACFSRCFTGYSIELQINKSRKQATLPPHSYPPQQVCVSDAALFGVDGLHWALCNFCATWLHKKQGKKLLQRSWSSKRVGSHHKWEIRYKQRFCKKQRPISRGKPCLEARKWHLPKVKLN